MDLPLGPRDISRFGMGMDLLVPEVISLISKLGAMMVLIRGSLKRSARAVQLFGRLAVLETHTL